MSLQGPRDQPNSPAICLFYSRNAHLRFPLAIADTNDLDPGCRLLVALFDFSFHLRTKLSQWPTALFRLIEVVQAHANLYHRINSISQCPDHIQGQHNRRDS